MASTYAIRKLQARALTEYGRLLALADDIKAVMGGEQNMSSRARKAAREMYSLTNALNLRAIDYRDPRGSKSRNPTEADVSNDRGPHAASESPASPRAAGTELVP